MKTMPLDNILAEILGDESSFPTGKEHRRVDSPAFIFFDDVEDERSPDESWFAGEALRFEAYLQREHAHLVDAWREERLADLFAERTEAKRYALWLIGFHKARPENNDRWRNAVTPLVEFMQSKECGPFICAIHAALREALPHALGPIGGTVFVNPDGTKHETAGRDMGRAKAAYCKRHKIEDEFVSVDRVQYDRYGRISKIVVGTRRTSDATPSHYYDPNPTWIDKKVGDGYQRAYAPGNATLIRVPDSNVMPFGSHRLTVREFEQSLIAGATILDHEDEDYAAELELEYNPDSRILSIEGGWGKAHRDQSALSYEEAFLFDILRNIAVDTDDQFWKDACEILTLEHQEPGEFARYFRDAQGQLSPAANILMGRARAFGSNDEIEFVKQALNITEIEIEEHQQRPEGVGPCIFDQIIEPDHMERFNGRMWSHLRW